MMPNKEKIEISALYGETEDEIQLAQCGDQVRMRLRGIEEDDISPYVLSSFGKALSISWPANYLHLYTPVTQYSITRSYDNY